MLSYQHEFIEYALEQNVLCFGEFTLKSGRISPYFFNSGLFNNGESLSSLGKYYAAAINSSAVQFDMLFGPAYKGIPLVSATAIALSQDYQKNIPYCFDRKEAKDHGEGGLTVGAQLQGRVLIIDDVISAGTSINHSVRLIQKAGAIPAGVAISLDRQERGQNTLSAVQEVEQRHNLKVVSIITLENLIEYLQTRTDPAEYLEKIAQYRQQYGIADNLK